MRARGVLVGPGTSFLWVRVKFLETNAFPAEHPHPNFYSRKFPNRAVTAHPNFRDGDVVELTNINTY